MAKIVTMMIAIRNSAYGDHDVLDDREFSNIQLAYSKSKKEGILNQLL
jgi:hypothetical protein